MVIDQAVDQWQSEVDSLNI